MPTYIVLSTLTSEGRETLKSKPERIKEVNKEIESLGVKVTAQYAVLGPYDFVNVIEAPDNETVARASVHLGSRGTVQLMSMPAIPIDQFISAVKRQTGSKQNCCPCASESLCRFGRVVAGSLS